jgi:CRISPR-associated endonuclease/helicase Cas3
LPISKYLSRWQAHKPFEVNASVARKYLKSYAGMSDRHLNAIGNKLDFFLETQFSFASLIEADKRDAGDNDFYHRTEQLEAARTHFHEALEHRFAILKQQEGEIGSLNALRATVRNEAVKNLGAALANGERIFTLTAPTGAGKTFALLALADAIRSAKGDYAVIYGLPFLSITEQVESVCRNAIWNEYPDFVTRFDSRAERRGWDDKIQAAEDDPTHATDLVRDVFSHETFDAAFTITTFVQIFETLLSNRNATLLKLPNFARSIFILDEIQALPPRLYVFFAAYLRAWCEKFDAYAIFSTATMPAFELAASRQPDPATDPCQLFSGYKPPAELLDFEQIYQQPIFNRYAINRIQEPLSISTLADAIIEQTDSALVILNTIEDTRKLYNEFIMRGFDAETVQLLNTHFILHDRQEKLSLCKERLGARQPIILISTQLIEAGVDIDFPVVFRDLCPLPNLVQSAGRCNRNGEQPCGKVFFFVLVGDNGKPRANLTYRDTSDSWILKFSLGKLQGRIEERDLLSVQQEYWKEINANLAVGFHKLKVNDQWTCDSLVRHINDLAFQVVGSFQLIDEREFGEEFRYYIPASLEDLAWEELDNLLRDFGQAHRGREKMPYEEVKLWQIKIEGQLRTMSRRVVTVRCAPEKAPPAMRRPNGGFEAAGLRKLANWDFDYTFEQGLLTSATSTAIL